MEATFALGGDGHFDAGTVDSEPLFESKGIDYIPLAERHGHPHDLAWLWAGALFNIEFVVYGALLIVAFGLRFWQAAVVVLVGNTTYIVNGLGSLQGPRAGTAAFTINRAPFGPQRRQADRRGQLGHPGRLRDPRACDRRRGCTGPVRREGRRAQLGRPQGRAGDRRRRRAVAAAAVRPPDDDAGPARDGAAVRDHLRGPDDPHDRQGAPQRRPATAAGRRCSPASRSCSPPAATAGR